MQMLGLKETVVQMAKANGVRRVRYGRMLRRDGGHVMRKAFEIEVKGKRSEERRVGKECRSRWSRYH